MKNSFLADSLTSGGIHFRETIATSIAKKPIAVPKMVLKILTLYLTLAIIIKIPTFYPATHECDFLIFLLHPRTSQVPSGSPHPLLKKGSHIAHSFLKKDSLRFPHLVRYLSGAEIVFSVDVNHPIIPCKLGIVLKFITLFHNFHEISGVVDRFLKFFLRKYLFFETKIN